jgi:hypothetical protein
MAAFVGGKGCGCKGFGFGFGFGARVAVFLRANILGRRGSLDF